ncbi:MAG: hypothetical protein FWF84_01680 [Kiritimatiellaeota bacterium]|nr:hypothetical protein [Kiritimatiellota bacterium]
MKKKPTLEEYHLSLDVVPVRNPRVVAFPAPIAGKLRLEIPVEYKFFWTRRRGKATQQFELDALGREVYEDIDDARTFETLIDRFAERHALTFFESRGLLAPLFHLLTQRGIIAATVTK